MGLQGTQKKRETVLKDKQKQPQPPVSKLLLIKLSMWYIPDNMIYLFIYLFFIYFNLFFFFWEWGKLVLIQYILYLVFFIIFHGYRSKNHKKSNHRMTMKSPQIRNFLMLFGTFSFLPPLDWEVALFFFLLKMLKKNPCVWSLKFALNVNNFTGQVKVETFDRSFFSLSKLKTVISLLTDHGPTNCGLIMVEQ